MKIEVFERLLTENDEKYGVKFTIGSQNFKLDYYGDREEAQWMKDMLIQAINNLITKTREETIREEIAYWTDVFDNRPKNRDLESDNIAQNFARIEIERLENKLK